MHRSVGWSRTLALATLTVAAACSGTASPSATGDEPPAAVQQVSKEKPVPLTDPPCIETIEIDHHSSVLQEQRSVGPHANDFQNSYPAEYIDLDSYTPVKTVAQYQMGGAALLWFTPDRTHAVVNAAVLSELTMADATQLDAGKRAVIGKITEFGLGRMKLPEMARFLLRSGTIVTYAHIGAKLCLQEETTENHSYRARFSGVHTYFTNKKNEEEFAFRLEISSTGELSITGGSQ